MTLLAVVPLANVLRTGMFALQPVSIRLSRVEQGDGLMLLTLLQLSDEMTLHAMRHLLMAVLAGTIRAAHDFVIAVCFARG